MAVDKKSKEEDREQEEQVKHKIRRILRKRRGQAYAIR